jgi:hypothetical protein
MTLSREGFTVNRRIILRGFCRLILRIRHDLVSPSSFVDRPKGRRSNSRPRDTRDAGAFFTYLLGLLVLTHVCPWKKLLITAEFNGILPLEARGKARAAKDHFDNLYLIVDQQHRWKSVLLPDPRPRVLDPLLVGELKQSHASKYYLIHQFDLTGAEQYLASEFAIKLGYDFACSPINELANQDIFLRNLPVILHSTAKNQHQRKGVSNAGKGKRVTAEGPKQSSIYDDGQAEREEGHRGT